MLKYDTVVLKFVHSSYYYVCMYVCMYVCRILTLTGMFVDRGATFARSEVLRAVWFWINVMWDVTLCC